MLGEILEDRRDQVVLATKFYYREGEGGAASDAVRRAVTGSLERVRTDRIDLYYLHRPDASTPVVETLTALDALVREGAVRAIGCSNFSAEQLAEADRVAREQGLTRFTVVQNHYNLLRRDDDEGVLPLCRELAIAYIPYFPLAIGLLTGKYARGAPAPPGTRLAGREIEEEQFDRIDELVRFARTSTDARCSSSPSARSPRRPALAPSSPARRSRSRCARMRRREERRLNEAELAALADRGGAS